MLEEYMDGQAISYKMLVNALNNNKLSHAYIFNSNGNSDVMNIVMCFVKMVITSSLSTKEANNISKRIDDGNYLDVKVIEADGLWIKKNQLLDLQSEFCKKAIEGNKKIYIIKDAEKMNNQTANSILKFLEEPTDDIMAILIVNNINLLLPTIISRCQVINLNSKRYGSSSLVNFSNLYANTKYNLLSEEDKNNIINKVIDFILYVEKYKLNTLIYENKLWHSNFKDRSDNIMVVQLMILFHYDVIKYKCGLEVNFFKDKLDNINEVVVNNSLNLLLNKILVLISTENGFRSNLNINLLIDKMIIDMCGDKNANSWC